MDKMYRKQLDPCRPSCLRAPRFVRGIGALLLLCWLASFGRHPCAALKAPIAEDLLFDPARVLNLTLLISSNEVESLKTNPRQRVVATLTESGRTYTNVALYLKGLGSFRPITEKPSFSIKFDEHAPGVRFLGHSRILLENSSQDGSFLRRKLTSELFLKAGIPAARVTYATVQLNGRKLGLYTLSEAMNRDFLARHFRSNSGNLYEGSNEDISGNLELDSGDASSSRAEIRALIAACEEPDLVQRWSLLQSRLDVDRFISFMALEVLICHHDGYSMDLNNYRLYHDPTTGRMVFMPHGMDLVFNRPSHPLEPGWRGLVATAVMETAEGKQRYRERIRQLAREVYGGDALVRRIDDLAAFLRPATSGQWTNERDPFEAAVALLRGNIRRRAIFVQGRP
jgi:spore coat protein H